MEQAAKAEAGLAHGRYASGLDDYASFLAAQQILVSAKSARAAGERELGYARLALHRAIGGAWATGQSEDSPPSGGTSAHAE